MVYPEDVTEELMVEARVWLSECGLASPESVEKMADEEVIRLVQQHHDGGWDEFVVCNEVIYFDPGMTGAGW